MNCRRARPLLLEFLEERLPAIAEVAVREHLAACPQCRAELELFRKTLLLAVGDTVPLMPIGANVFLGNVRRRIRAANATPERGRIKTKLWPVLAAAVVLLAIGILFLSRGPQSQRSPDDLVITGEPAAADIIDQAGTETDLVRQIDAQSISAIESELADNAELDDLIEELTPQQQEALVRELTRLYRAPAKPLNGG